MANKIIDQLIIYFILCKFWYLRQVVVISNCNTDIFSEKVQLTRGYKWQTKL